MADRDWQVVTSAAPAGPADVDATAHVFVESLDDTCEISGDDGHHLQRVRRVDAGELVTAADDTGAWRLYEVARVGAARLTLHARGEPFRAEEPAVGVELAVALLKHGLDDVVAAVTELGVARITLVRTARCVVRWDDARAAKAVERLQVIAREASMQSRRACIPRVVGVRGIDELAARPGLLIADRAGIGVAELPLPEPPGWTVLVGPEGGLARDDLESLPAAPRLALGPHVLRAVTAPIAAVAVLAARAAAGPHQ